MGRSSLAITRRYGESVWIGTTKVTLKKKRGTNACLLIIEADLDVKVRRQELVERDEKEAAEDQPEN